MNDFISSENNVVEAKVTDTEKIEGDSRYRCAGCNGWTICPYGEDKPCKN